MIKVAFIDTFAIAIAYIVMGVAFGILAFFQNFNFFEILCCAIFVFSGSLQFLLLTLLAENTSLFGILIAASLLNLRHIFYIMSCMRYFRTMKFIKYYAVFALTDESFALLSANNYDNKTAIFILFLNHFYWVLGCVLGFCIASFSSVDYSSLSFSQYALFIILAYELCLKSKNKFAISIAFVIGIIGLFFVPKEFMLLICMTCGICILLIGKKLCLIR
ncbi:AzlC family ABC transporter permease [Campylobacter sp. MG1]|uniref:AzlC family ABC transporter permease n=1 Tax=Campylobacter sp. MG1 TaxID=2976332 RepID=UPI00226CCECA|nr:AzlC family ABC transporter permease [Campylobacter sp. MG1]